MPRSDVIILTDPGSKFSVNQGSATLLPIEGNYSRGNLMLQRIKTYIVSVSASFRSLNFLHMLSQNYLCDPCITAIIIFMHYFEL